MQWKPIKTAPKDRHILLHANWARTSYMVEGWWEEAAGAFCSHHDRLIRATHWDDLPKRPAGSRRADTSTWRSPAIIDTELG